MAEGYAGGSDEVRKDSRLLQPTMEQQFTLVRLASDSQQMSREQMRVLLLTMMKELQLRESMIKAYVALCIENGVDPTRIL